MPESTDFAKLREENIAKNKALLEQLELKEAVEGLNFPAAKPETQKGAKPVQSSRSKKRKAPEPAAPRRHSTRLKAVTAIENETPEEKAKREAEEEERRAQEEKELIEREERERLLKRPRHHDLDLATMGEEMTSEELKSLTATLAGFSKVPTRERSISEKEVKEEEDAIEELRQQYRKVKIVSRAKVTQDRVYCSLYHPERTKDLVFFGDKHGQLGIWDALAPAEEIIDEDGNVEESEEGGRIFRLQPHWPATSKSSISCIRLDPLDARNLYTSAYDCTLRSISFESGVSREVMSFDGSLINSFDILPNGHEIWISDADGYVTHADLREKKSRAMRYQLSDQKIGCVSVNPIRNEAILTSSNNRTLKLWDARKLSTLPVAVLPTPPPSSPVGPKGAGNQEEPAEIDMEAISNFKESAQGKGTLMADWGHNKSVSSAYWDPSGSKIVSTSYDDTLRLWNVNWKKMTADTKVKSFKPFARLHHNCQTGKWLTILKSQWNQNPDVFPHFTVGNMNHSLNVISGTGEVIAALYDREMITAVQAVTSSHPSIIARVASGNASGRCVLWAPDSST